MKFNINEKIRNLCAFTLAEVLVVMGLIGVIAALSIPSLNIAVSDKEAVTRLRKSSQNIEEAMAKAVAKYGEIDNWFTDVDMTDDNWASVVGRRTAEFLTISTNCELTKNNCFCTYFGTSAADRTTCNQDVNLYSFILGDTISVAFGRDFYGSNIMAIDIDGPFKGKNMEGYDQFHFNVNSSNASSVISKNNLSAFRPADNTPCSKCSNSWCNCTDWVLKNGNRDYLTVNSSTYTCSDGSTVLGYGSGKATECND